MNSERLIRIIAGSFILLSLFLSYRYSGMDEIFQPSWLWFTAFVGINLLQSGFTRWCLMEQLLVKAGMKSCCGQNK